MKTIEEASRSHEINRDKNSIGSLINKNTITSFKAGVEFAQRWIPVSEELPESNHKGKVLTKGLMGSMIKEEFIELAKYRNNKFSNEMDWKYVTHWRPINLE